MLKVKINMRLAVSLFQKHRYLTRRLEKSLVITRRRYWIMQCVLAWPAHILPFKSSNLWLKSLLLCQSKSRWSAYSSLSSVLSAKVYQKLYQSMLLQKKEIRITSLWHHLTSFRWTLVIKALKYRKSLCKRRRSRSSIMSQSIMSQTLMALLSPTTHRSKISYPSSRINLNKALC